MYTERDLWKKHIQMKRDLQKRPTESFTHPDLSDPRKWQFKRDLYTWKETHNHAKKPIHMKRDPQTRPKKTIQMKKGLHTRNATNMFSSELDIYIWKWHLYMEETWERDPLTPLHTSAHQIRKSCRSKEIYTYVKRHMYMKRDLGKRPTDSSAYLSASDSRANCRTNETYVRERRPIFTDSSAYLGLFSCTQVSFHVYKSRLIW